MAELTIYGETRKKTGRKTITDKKITVTIYPRLSRIEMLGIDAVRTIATSAVEKEYFKKQKTA